MKKSDLIRVIREVVKREVKVAIKEELSNVVKPVKNKQKSNVDFSSNPVLNEVMQETAASDWSTMGNRTLGANDAMAGRAGLASMMGMESPDQMFGEKPSVQQMIPEDKKHVEIPDDISTALTRDYSQLMKAIDKKKQNK